MLFIGAQTPRIGGSARKALRCGPEPALYASLDVDGRITRRQTRAKLSSTTESSIAGRRTTETIRKNDRDVRGRRRGSPAAMPVVDRQSGSTCATAALTPGRLGRGRRAENIGGDGLKVNQRLSLNPARFSSSKRAVSGGRPSHNGKRRMPVIVWICLYSLVAVGLPHHHGVGVGGLAGGDHGGLVEDGGDGGDSGHFVCSCGYAGTSGADGLLFFFPVTPRWTCTRGFARVGSWKQLSGKHDKTEACFRLRGRIYGVCSVMTPKSPSHGKNRL